MLDGAAMCALDRSRLTSLLKRGTATLRYPMDTRAASEVASCLLARRDVLLEAGAAKAAVQPAPDHFFCSLTLEVMADPVRVYTGQVYEREEITRWLRGNIAPRCPNTNVVLTTGTASSVKDTPPPPTYSPNDDRPHKYSPPHSADLVRKLDSVPLVVN